MKPIISKRAKDVNLLHVMAAYKLVPDSRVELEKPERLADFERVISNLDYLFAFNFTWSGSGFSSLSLR